MFVYSIKSSKLKIAAITAAVIIAVFAIVFYSPKEKPAVNSAGISLKAGTNEERIAFLSQFGWDIDEDPIEVTEVIIPSEFDSDYEMYNKIQAAQKFDLLPFAGKRVKRWTYSINNYPQYEDKKGVIRANILVYEGAVIGGDICSIELDGFMQGFDFPNKSNQQAQMQGQK